MLKSTTKNDEVKELKNKTEKHDDENDVLKSLKIDNEYNRKKIKPQIKRKYF